MKTSKHYHSHKQYKPEPLFDYTLDNWQTVGAWAFFGSLFAVLASVGLYLLAVYVL